eukprot:COSAG05_NODE_15170_length_376_cov_1.563177_1_plen_114_part_10
MPTGDLAGDLLRVASFLAARDHCIPLARLLLACRSSDLACIFRGVRSNVKCLRFEYDSESVLTRILTGVSLRFYRPKERNSMPVSSKGYSRWVTIPVVTDKLICFATLLQAYVL